MVFTYLVQAFMGNGPFEPALFVSETVTFFGVMLITYKSMKALKAMIDAAIEVVDPEHEAEPNPSLLQRASDLWARLLGSGPAVRVEANESAAPEHFINAKDRATQLLEFWILFGSLTFLHSFSLPYATELRGLLVALAVVPREFGMQWVEKVFATVAPLLFGVYIPSLVRWMRRHLRLFGGASSPAVRWAFSVAAHDQVVQAAPMPDLLELQEQLEGALNVIASERKRRQKAMRRSVVQTHRQPATLQYRLDPEDEEADLLGEFGDFAD